MFEIGEEVVRTRRDFGFIPVGTRARVLKKSDMGGIKFCYVEILEGIDKGFKIWWDVNYIEISKPKITWEV